MLIPLCYGAHIYSRKRNYDHTQSREKKYDRAIFNTPDLMHYIILRKNNKKNHDTIRLIFHNVN